MIKYTPSLIGSECEISFFNVKQDIYRLPDRLLEGLALHQGIIAAKSTWQMLNALFQTKKFE